jgi:hypothetical protein
VWEIVRVEGLLDYDYDYAEKLLAAFKHLTLTLFRVKGEWYGDVTELNPLQNQILFCLGLSPDIYSGLVENST